ncbi:hypothetical protein [Chromatium okenii]|uniref:hypothetical protein n=1 Tax=Chromatium okenii TaxID=61644 RepID=UPI00190551FF|nr:hypothetical protein [Chromatium okenii]
MFEHFMLDLAQNEYRQQCFGLDTFGCQNMKINFQVKLAEFEANVLREGEEKYISVCGKKSYDEVMNMILEWVSILEEKRPNFFLRFFMSDRQGSPSDIPDFTDLDYAQLVEKSCPQINLTGEGKEPATNIVEKDDELSKKTDVVNIKTEENQLSQDTGKAQELHRQETLQTEALRSAEIEQQQNNERKTAALITVQQYFDAVNQHQISTAVQILENATSKTWTLLENTEWLDLKELVLLSITKDEATLNVSFEGKSKKSRAQKYQGIIPLRWNGNRWQIVTLNQLVKQ